MEDRLTEITKKRQALERKGQARNNTPAKKLGKTADGEAGELAAS